MANHPNRAKASRKALPVYEMQTALDGVHIGVSRDGVYWATFNSAAEASAMIFNWRESDKAGARP